MKYLRTTLIVSFIFAVPSLGSTQQLPRNLSCQDLLDVASGRMSRSYDGGKTYVPIAKPNPVDGFGQSLLAYDTSLCKRLFSREISVEEFNSLHAAKVQSLNAERQRIAVERQKLAIEASKLQAQRQAVELQRGAIERQQAWQQQQLQLQQQQLEQERQRNLQQWQLQQQQVEQQRQQVLQQQRQSQELEAIRQQMQQQQSRSVNCYGSGNYLYCN